MRRIGAHLSCAGGYENGLNNAERVGANALQIFSGSPRIWARKPLNDEELEHFSAQADKRDIRPLFVHALYLVNLASETKESVQKSIDVLIHELKFGMKIKSEGVVVHLGSHQGRGWEAVKQDVAQSIKHIITASGSTTPFLIENSAGQKGKLCSDLAEIRWLLDEVNEPTLGWCYDTCHGWAAGYSETQKEGKRLFEAVEQFDLWDSLRCLHANDSRDPFNSGRDRHANFLKGTIPHEEWDAILGEKRWQHIPLITEVPGEDGEGPDKPNIDVLRTLAHA
jgi:deoxyribonuclease-4